MKSSNLGLYKKGIYVKIVIKDFASPLTSPSNYNRIFRLQNIAKDSYDRLRFIKYTPKYDYCYAIFYGNFAPQGTGLFFTQSLSNKLSKFRIAATGVVLELNHQFDIMKKLQLVEEPFKVIKNTAFIKGMFNSSLEVAKFQGGLIKTVSGLRGHIKKNSKLGLMVVSEQHLKTRFKQVIYYFVEHGLECISKDFIILQQMMQNQ